MKHQLNVNLHTDLIADLTGNSFENVFKLLLVAVDVPTDSPDQFEAIQQRGQSLNDFYELALVERTELTLKSLQEL
jgi:hypothetical protein